MLVHRHTHKYTHIVAQSYTGSQACVKQDFGWLWFEFRNTQTKSKGEINRGK